MKNLVLLIIIISLLFSCNNNPSKSVIRVYYPIDSLVASQISYFVANDAKLIKSNTDSSFSKQNQLLDSSGWAEELEIFYNLNINKPTFIDAYEKRVIMDDKSNLNILRYSAIEDKMAIEEINIYYFKTLEDIKRISASINNKNTLFSSSKSLQMVFRDRENLTVLTSYSINGDQKMVMRDSLMVSISGRINY